MGNHESEHQDLGWGRDSDGCFAVAQLSLNESLCQFGSLWVFCMSTCIIQKPYISLDLSLITTSFCTLPPAICSLLFSFAKTSSPINAMLSFITWNEAHGPKKRLSNALKLKYENDGAKQSKNEPQLDWNTDSKNGLDVNSSSKASH